ncbi:DoxX family protein [Streptomyces spinoverrucosus]|uniref:DoxX family protein n=1 Tax=Streptomyces spinoverrucosus TaxID=284043 RepID=UPI0018C3F683|nr:DoxX family protein [Streptomyces spinoverrucosus]MBG0852589.1 DoxX family protein [Streptomyces spinoverrucosus]
MTPPTQHSPLSTGALGTRPAPRPVGAADVGVLLLRLAVGLILAGHGAQKLFGMFGGPGLDATGKAFAQQGYEPGVFFAGLAGASEVLGGLGLAVGLLTPLAAAATVGVMINAMAVAPEYSLWPAGPPSFAHPLLFAVGALAIAAVGPGRLSLDAFFPWRDGGWIPFLVALGLGVLGGVLVVLFAL